MALVSTRIHRRRLRALRRLEPIACRWQSHLSAGSEQLHLAYQPGSRLEEEEAEEPWRLSIEEQLRQQRGEEERLGSCRVGPHRDEVALQLGGTPARRFGSSGQQRSLVLGLKLAELELVTQLFGEAPLLLLDDVLAELDPQPASACCSRPWARSSVPGERHAPRRLRRRLAQAFADSQSRRPESRDEDRIICAAVFSDRLMEQTLSDLHPNPGWTDTNGQATDMVGKHCILELYDCDPARLDDEAFLRTTITTAAKRAGATLLNLITHRFEPQGVTGLALLAESHISIHTWPESGYAAVDVFTCGDHTMPEQACAVLSRNCRPGVMH